MQNINEELNRMLYLTQHKRGIVISEQSLTGDKNRPTSNVNTTTNAPDWNGSSTGTIDVSRFSKDSSGIPVNATNVSYNQEVYNLSINKSISKNLPYTISNPIPPEKGKEPLNFKFIDDSYPYEDNMITPKLSKNPTAESLLNLVVKIISDNIGLNGLESMKSINLQGFADSARPGIRGPKGTKEEVSDDHLKAGCSKIYCGEKDDSKRNLWLAENRAKRMGSFLTKLVKQSTGTDISSLIKYLEPVSSFDPTINSEEGNRVGERSVSIDVIKSGDISTPTSTTGKTETITFVPIPKKGTIIYGDVTLNLVELIDDKGYSKITVEKTEECLKLIGNKIPNLLQSGQLNGKSKVNSEIKNNEVIVDGLSWGSLQEYPEGAYAKIKYVTVPGVLCLVGEYDNTMELSVYSVLLAEKPI